MSAKLVNKIPKQAYELILPRIGEILVEEIAYQLTLPDNDVFASALFLERSPSIDETEMPCINVRLARGAYENRSYVSVDGLYTFYVDCYASSSTTVDENEFTESDKTAALKLHRLMGVCRAILQNQAYKTLGFENPFIQRVTVKDVEIANPTDHDMKSTIMGRLQIDVLTVETSELKEPSLLDGFDTQVKLGSTDRGYVFSGDNPPPIPPPTCENGEVFINEVKFGEVLSGGQIFIQVIQNDVEVGELIDGQWVIPNCPPSTFDLSVNNTLFKEISDNYNLDVLDTDLNSVGTPQIVNNRVIIADSEAVIKDSANTTLKTAQILAEGSEDITIDDATIDITDSQLNLLYSESLKAESSNSRVIENSTLNVNKSDGTLISSQSILAEGVSSYNVADSVAVIKDSLGTTLKSENILATASENITINHSVAVIKDSANNTLKSENILAEATENIVINDSTVNVNKSNGTLISAVSVKAENSANYNVSDSNITNSDSTYDVDVKATENLILPDSQINVNGVDSGDVVSVKTIDINIEDSTSTPITPTSVGIVGNTVTIAVPSGGSPPFDPDALVFEVSTNLLGTTNANQFRIVVTGTGNNYDVVTSDGQTINGNTGNLTITFPSEGIYTIEIKGLIRPYYLTDLDKNKLLRVLNWGISAVIEGRAFESMPRFDVLATDNPLLNTSIARLFFNTTSLVFNNSINNWDVSLVTSIQGMFFNCTGFNQPLNDWDTSAVTGLGFCSTTVGLFNGCANFNQPLNNWDVSGATVLRAMFQGCTRFNQPLNLWDTGAVTNYESMFEGATLFNQDISMWDVSAATNMPRMFISSAINQNLGAWQFGSGLTNLALIFRFSAMSTANYTDTIVGWANHVFNSGGIPSGVNMSTQTGMTFDTSRSGGANFANAGAARTYLTGTATWTISGDTVI